ncbi:glycosyl hydrolase [Dactylonectria macrodidyma]|uniref:Glycosyl hydrolase n=1 Tax=Dactylonectria macrodidyma TaxID=307937 RepID=A0A9P9F898_9HYPO|nr:glycosyl hydrolase [Dactylonectria macrodidyma]
MAPLRGVIWGCILLFSSSAWGIWNPIISGWNPDPAILAVGDDYYIATSSFEYWPGIPIYHSKDLSNWTLFSHALTRPEQLQLFGTPTAAGGWAPSLAYINGKYWLSTMTRWTYDPVSRVWPRVLFFSSKDLITWSDPIWAEPWGIDPELFQDPKTKKTYLNLMAPNNNIDRVWGISQCEVSLSSGQCTGPYVSLWNGTLPSNSTARPEGPKMYYKDSWYYLLIAEGGTDNLHRSTIARSKSPSGPFTANPANPLMYNGQWGFDNLTVQSTGHATMMKTANGDWYASFLARRNINEKSPLGRETFLTNVVWRDGWPVFNNGKPILLSEEVEPKSGPKKVPKKWVEKFKGSNWDDAWYQLRTPYTKNYDTTQKGLILRPNVFGLSDRDTPAALLRKQTSLNMTFSAEVLGFSGNLGPRNKVGISAYLSEWQHQDIGIRGCVNQTGMCIYTESFKNKTTTYWQTPLPKSDFPRRTMTLHVRCTPLLYQLGYSFGKDAPTYPTNISSFWQAFGPVGYGIFTGASLALFGTGDGEPWPYNAPTVGFSKVTETYFQEDIPDYDRW